jgi:drug/metabolite transporter (DMT)-like permease
VLQFTFLRGACCLALGLAYGYGSLKKNLVDQLDKSTLPSLAFRCIQGAMSVYISFMCIRYFDVSTVSIVCSMHPVFVCLLAYTLLGERLKHSDKLSLVVVVLCVCLVILGGETRSTEAATLN